MRLSRFIKRSLLVLILILGLAGTMRAIHQVHAAGTLSIDSSPLTPVPKGTPLQVSVRVDGMDAFNGWYVSISTNTEALNSTSIDYSTQTIFPTTPTPEVNCVNGVPQVGSCTSVDGAGVVTTEGIILGTPPPAPLSGILFSINYLAGSLNFTNIHFIKEEITYGGCSCDIVHDTFDGMYGTPPSPDFSLSLRDQSLYAVQGSSVSSAVNVSSVAAFSGRVNFTYTASAAGITVAFQPDNVTVNNSTALAKLTVSIGLLSPIPGDYLLNITGTSGSLVHFAFLDMHVEGHPDFSVGIAPGQLSMPQNSSSFAIVTVSSNKLAGVSEFSGNVSLSVAVPYNETTGHPLGVNGTLAQTSLYVSAGSSNSTTLSVSIPLSFYAYRYLVNITASWVQNPTLKHTATLTIIPPPYDLAPTVSPTSLTILAGHSGYATLSVIGVNYFVGPVYASSTMTGGTARYLLNESEVYLAVGGTASFSLNITIDPATTPGSYVALLTAYSGTGIARSVSETVIVKPAGQSVATRLPITILGLSVPVYFGVLGVFAALFVVLSVFVYRRGRLDRDEGWENE